MKKLSLSALAAAGVLAGMSAANAADLGVGGNCCADLEERIAELEATTARKGNRKVSLTVSGWVTQQLLIWDDGVESNAYVVDAGTTLASHVKFTGSAQINADVSAGYLLQIEAIGSDPLFVTQDKATANKAVGVLQSFWFMKSNALGKISVGLQSSAADNVAILPDGSGSLVPANYVLFDNNSFFLRSSGVRLGNNWGQLATCPKIQIGVSADCDGVPNNNIRYDSPTFAGFSASWSWGEDDIWAVAGRYAGEFNSIKVAAAIAYTESNDGPAQSDFFNNQTRRDGAALQIGAYVQHVPTGLFVYGAYGKDYNSNLLSAAERTAFGNKKDGDNFYVKAGLRQKWSPLGHSVLFGEYGENNDKQSVALFTSGLTSSNLSQWGLGYVQEIDAAAMSVWFVYRNFSGDGTCAVAANQAACGGKGKIGYDDFDLFKIGALINF